MSWSMENRQG